MLRDWETTHSEKGTQKENREELRTNLAKLAIWGSPVLHFSLILILIHHTLVCGKNWEK